MTHFKLLLTLLLFMVDTVVMAQSKQPTDKLQTAKFAVGFHKKNRPVLHADTLKATINVVHRTKHYKASFIGYVVRDGNETRYYNECWQLMPMYFHVIEKPE